MSITSLLFPWQYQDWQILNRYFKQNRIPQALLISGGRGIGKINLAKQFAYSLLCPNRGGDGINCGNCEYCLLIKAGNHPDFIEIISEENKTSISINQIRGVIVDTYLKPQFENYRVIIIHPADGMTISAANAFLKSLEEPPERTVFILLTDRPNKLSATIRSRCQKFSASYPDIRSLGEWMQNNNIYGDAASVINLVKGSILTLKQLEDSEGLKQRLDCFNDWLALASYHSHPAIVAEKWDVLPENEVLDWILSWVVDIIKYAFKINIDMSSNQDLIYPLQKISQQANVAELYKLYDHLLSCRQQLGRQLNFQIMLEEILARWQQLNRSKLHG